jgi:hypothetical protein
MTLPGERRKQRFLRSFDEDPSGCWLWTGTITPQGYGQFSYNRKTYKAHRIAWWYFKHEEIPDDLAAHHTCGVKNCVNPDHLELMTHAEHLAHHMTERT